MLNYFSIKIFKKPNNLAGPDFRNNLTLFEAASGSLVIQPAGRIEFTHIKQPETVTDPLGPGVDCELHLWWHQAGVLG